jgi:glycosyltransferase involved in cell wall biosynthesis
MQQNLVSIITPMYNAARFVGQTIESVLAQTCPRWEMLIVDDGSKDSSYDIAVAYAKKDPRIKVFRQENAGSAAARNNGIRRAEGRYIALLDADDLWDPIFLESQLNLMKEKNAVVVCAACRRIDEHTREILHPQKVKPVISLKSMQMTNHIPCLTGLYDTMPFGKVYLREELKSIRDDYAFWLDIVQRAGKAYGNQQILASYRVLSNSTTGNKKKLIKPQFLFYYKYQHLGLLKSVAYTLYWGVLGWIKFNKGKKFINV